MIAGTIGAIFLIFPEQLLAFFGLKDAMVVEIGQQLLRYLSVSGLFITVALTYTGGLQGTGDTRSPLFITLVAQIGVPLGLCFYLQATGQLAAALDLAGDRPRPLHAMRAVRRALPPGKVEDHRRAGLMSAADTHGSVPRRFEVRRSGEGLYPCHCSGAHTTG